MDNRQNPNNLKPVNSQKSAGAVAKPRQNGLNTTHAVSRSHDVSVVRSSSISRCNARNPRIRNLDAATSGAGCPSIEPSTTNDEDLFDLVYSDCLTAQLKQELVKKNIKEHEIKLYDQILIQTEHLHKLENTFKNISNEIENLIEQSDIVEQLQVLKDSVIEIEAICSRHNCYNRLNQLKQILIKESDLVSIKNLNPINSQEEYDKLISILMRLKSVMQKIINGDRNFKEVNELSLCIKAFNELNTTISVTAQKLCNSNKTASSLALGKISDFFAERGGYF